MSTKAVIVWLTLAAVLGIIAIVVLMMPKNAPPSGSVSVGLRILSFKPGEVERIVVSTPGQPRQVIEKPTNSKSILGADAEWQLVIDGAKQGESAAQPWPLESAKMQSLLRVLSEMRAAAVPAAGMELGAATIAEIFLTGNRTIKLSLAERTLAGTGLIQIDAPPAAGARALVPDQIHAVFTDPGARGWRDPFPLGGIAPDASRIRIEGKGKPLVLGKIDGKWSLREPVQAPADPVAVQRLLGALGKISIADFLDSGVAAANSGLEKPMGSVTIEADRRTIPPGATEPKISTDTVTLSLGGAADAAVSRLYCSVGGTRTVLINAASVRDIGADPGAVVWAHPLRETPSDIGTIAITLMKPIAATSAEKSFKRADGRWVQVIADNADVPLAAREQRDVDALLVMLTGAQIGSASGEEAKPLPRPVATIDAPVGYQVLGSIAVGSLAARPIETLEFAIAEKDVIVVRTGPVYRVYGANALPELLRAAVQASEKPVREKTVMPVPMVP